MAGPELAVGCIVNEVILHFCIMTLSGGFTDFQAPPLAASFNSKWSTAMATSSVVDLSLSGCLPSLHGPFFYLSYWGRFEYLCSRSASS